MSDPEQTATEQDIRGAREIGIEISSAQVGDLSRQDILFDATENPSVEIPQNGSNPYQEGVLVESRLTPDEVERFVYLIRLALVKKIQVENQRRYEAEMQNDDLRVFDLNRRRVIYEKADGVEITNQLQPEALAYLEAIAAKLETEIETVKRNNREPER